MGSGGSVACLTLAPSKHNQTAKLHYFSKTTLRKVFLLTTNPLYQAREQDFQDKASTIPSMMVGLRLRVYTGCRWKKKHVSKWAVGFKFGEFVSTRRVALYKAKQKKKKKK